MNLTWDALHEVEFKKPYFKQLKQFLTQEITNQKVVYPHPQNFFKAFEYCTFADTKVVILGQDPYHGPGQAQGLSFSVPENIKTPPSLKNIFKALKNDLNINAPAHGNLTSWAEQGVLLLNSTLSVQAKSPASHANQGWETFTDTMITALSEQKSNLVFLLWGKFAHSKAALINSHKHLVLKAPHPSPFSAHTGFFDCQHFSKTNTYLSQTKQIPINWQIK